MLGMLRKVRNAEQVWWYQALTDPDATL